MTIHFSRVLLVAAILVCSLATANADTVHTLNLAADDIAYTSNSGLFYASIPNSASLNPNTLLPINPTTLATGSAISIGFNPTAIAVSSDGTNLFTVVDGDAGVQRYHVPTQAVDQLFTLGGGTKVGDIYGVPGSPDQVILHVYQPATSPPAVFTGIWQDGTRLPDQIGQGTGVGGPDIFAVDPSDGTKGYGYQNTVSSYTNWRMTLSSNGVDTTPGPNPLQGSLTGFNISNIAIEGDHLYTNLGQVWSMSLGVQVGAFNGGSDFVLDPTHNWLFSITSSGSNQTVNVYSGTTLALLGTDTFTGISGTTSNLTRFGTDGLAFQTSTGEIVFIEASIVPEPSTWIMLMIGAIGLLVCSVHKLRQPC